MSVEQGRVLYLSPRSPTNLLFVFSSVVLPAGRTRGRTGKRFDGTRAATSGKIGELRFFILCLLSTFILTAPLFCAGYEVSVAGGARPRNLRLGMAR